MKIYINQIPPDGLTLFEEFTSSGLDLDTEIIRFSSPIRVTAEISRITNAVTVYLALNTTMQSNCSRCLEEFKIDFKKNIQLNYPVNKLEPIIDTSTSLNVNGECSRTIELESDIREEIILDYPIKPLCKPDCRGLCQKCGKNLNQGGCSCGTT